MVKDEHSEDLNHLWPSVETEDEERSRVDVFVSPQPRSLLPEGTLTLLVGRGAGLEGLSVWLVVGY